MTVIKKIETFVFRYPLKNPVITSFGVMDNRPMVLIKIIDNDGAEGWGEVWCNFPLTGAEHRARLIDNVFFPLLDNKKIETPNSIFEYLVKSTEILSVQADEPGPIAQCIAGIDIAINDLIAKKENIPLWKKLGGKNKVLPIYASGINPTDPVSTVKNAIKNDFKAFKLKIGFEFQKDLQNIKKIKNILSDDERLMVDANQAWDPSEAKENCKHLEEFNLNWLEEPILANSSLEAWINLKKEINIPLAGGENLSENHVFESFLNSNVLSYIQPDIAKWGGFSKCFPLVKKIIENGNNYCPHFLGGGIGLIASTHLLSASNSSGILEVDINENPLRSDLIGDLLFSNSGYATLSDKPGLGYEPQLKNINKYLVAH